jgi:hypothetical protein
VDPIPVLPFDLSRRYDIHCSEIGYDRLFENVRFVCVRTFDRINEFSSGLLGGYLEIEAADGARCLIPTFGIRAICEHGVQPAFKVLRHRRQSREE